MNFSTVLVVKNPILVTENLMFSLGVSTLEHVFH